MPYTESQLDLIRKKFPELKLKLIPKLDEVIVKFLEKFEVFVKPASTSKRNIKNDAISGAITGFAGADVGGDAFMVSGQQKQTAVQEWTQWKQWALDHKDFESFKIEMINKANKYNEDIKDKLKNPEIQKELDIFIKNEKEKEIAKEKAEKDAGDLFAIIFCVICFSLLGYAAYETRKDSSKNYSPNMQVSINYQK